MRTARNAVLVVTLLCIAVAVFAEMAVIAGVLSTPGMSRDVQMFVIVVLGIVIVFCAWLVRSDFIRFNLVTLGPGIIIGDVAESPIELFRSRTSFRLWKDDSWVTGMSGNQPTVIIVPFYEPIRVLAYVGKFIFTVRVETDFHEVTGLFARWSLEREGGLWSTIVGSLGALKAHSPESEEEAQREVEQALAWLSDYAAKVTVNTPLHVILEDIRSRMEAAPLTLLPNEG